MLKPERESRSALGFREATLASFEFLRSHGFKPIEKGPTFVRFESQTGFVNVYHGRSSYEIGVELGLKASTEKYGLDYIVSWAGKSAWEAEGFGRGTIFQVSSREGVQRLVPRVAELLRKYGDLFLGGDADFYKQLDEANQRASAEYARQHLLRDVRKQAEAAWSEKAFARLIKLYESIQKELTAIEAKRLAYAQKCKASLGP